MGGGKKNLDSIQACINGIKLSANIGQLRVKFHSFEKASDASVIINVPEILTQELCYSFVAVDGHRCYAAGVCAQTFFSFV